MEHTRALSIFQKLCADSANSGLDLVSFEYKHGDVVIAVLTNSIASVLQKYERIGCITNVTYSAELLTVTIDISHKT